MKNKLLTLSAILLFALQSNVNAYTPSEFNLDRTNGGVYHNDRLKGAFTSVNFQEAWEQTLGSKDIKVGIIDALGEGENHGKFILSQLESKHNDYNPNVLGSGLVGFAPNLTYVLKDVCDNYRCTNSKTAVAVRELVDEGVDIISISAIWSHTNDLELAFNYARDKGVSVITASNNKFTATRTPFNCTSNVTLCVGGSYYEEDAIHRKLYKGDDIELLAHMYYPRGIWGDRVTGRVGTSFAVPAVTATIGLMKSVNDNLTRAEIEDIIYSTATKLDTGRFLLNAGGAVAKAKSLLSGNQDTEVESQPEPEPQPIVEPTTCTDTKITYVTRYTYEQYNDEVLKRYIELQKAGNISEQLINFLLYLLK